MDLSLDTLEQQIKDKTVAAKKLESARKQRILIETKEFQQNEEKMFVHMVEFLTLFNNECGILAFGISNLISRKD